MLALIINLALVLFWLTIGGLIFYVEHQTGEPFINTIIPAGWFAMMLAGYNVIRVITIWTYMKKKKQEEPPEEPFHRRRIEEPPNPDFQFTDVPPKDEG